MFLNGGILIGAGSTAVGYRLAVHVGLSYDNMEDSSGDERLTDRIAASHD